MKLSVLSLYQTDLSQDREEKENRSKIMNNRTEKLIQLISKVHSMYLGPKIFGVRKALAVEFITKTNRKGLRHVSSRVFAVLCRYTFCWGGGGFWPINQVLQLNCY